MRDDDDVKMIALDVNSPGGGADGCFELCRELREIANQKPMIAVVNSMAASAGYAIASSASTVAVTPSGSAGSISVYRIRVDLSKMLANDGIDYYVIEADERKADGHFAKPMSETELKESQESVEKRRDEFFDLIVENRDIDQSALAEMQGRLYRADEALALGLIDAVSTPTEAVSAFIAELANDEPNEGDEEMTTNTTKPDAVAEAARKEGEDAAKNRIKGIMTSDEAKSRQGQAEHIAYNTDLSVDDAKAMLAASASETSSEPAPVAAPAVEAVAAPAVEAVAAPAVDQSQFANAMNTGGGAGVGAAPTTGAAATGALSDEDKASAILSDQTAVTGRKFSDQ
jgi:signal peptide peptidase SppA